MHLKGQILDKGRKYSTGQRDQRQTVKLSWLMRALSLQGFNFRYFGVI